MNSSTLSKYEIMKPSSIESLTLRNVKMRSGSKNGAAQEWMANTQK